MSTILDCGHEESPHSEFTTGYGVDSDGKKYCYACCADSDRQTMDETGKYTLYLVKRDDGGYKVTNWPGSLEYKVRHYRRGRHNIAGTRIDVWFYDYQGRLWHGYQLGEFTQICHVQRNKENKRR